ncbi:hypothetical protein FQN55_008480 [Onygenales sp. PD_40]|nr:hypothetical protein FQN55_008480 [Onygenales sp. PD_40]KAK2784810.1 hypothetical protein FQN51_003967 [Onygenales sp. PD_10]
MKHFSTAAVRGKLKPPLASRFGPLDTLSAANSDISTFRDSYFTPQLPVLLSRGHFNQLPAIQKWFSQPGSSSAVASLDYSYLQKYSDCPVPLELTTSTAGDTTFRRLHAPLDLFLKWTKTATRTSNPGPITTSLYLAQCQLLDLPPLLRADIPTPPLVSTAGRGDIYDTNIWIGIPPTYTPLHRDPNPNLFVQLAGRKVVRLLAPQTGLGVFQRVRERIAREHGELSGGGASFRGEEMMQGVEREALENEVWGDEGSAIGEGGIDGFEAELDAGDGIFIPMGWWHSIKGVGEGVTASVNWWFR